MKTIKITSENFNSFLKAVNQANLSLKDEFTWEGETYPTIFINSIIPAIADELGFVVIRQSINAN